MFACLPAPAVRPVPGRPLPRYTGPRAGPRSGRMAIRAGRRPRAHLAEGRLCASQAPRAPGHQAQHPGRAPTLRSSSQPVSQRCPLVGKAPPGSTKAQYTAPYRPAPNTASPVSAPRSSTPWRRCWRRSRPCESRCRPRSSASHLWRICCASSWTARTSAAQPGRSEPGGPAGRLRSGALHSAPLGLGGDWGGNSALGGSPGQLQRLASVWRPPGCVPRPGFRQELALEIPPGLTGPQQWCCTAGSVPFVPRPGQRKCLVLAQCLEMVGSLGLTSKG